jgi:hypothetical protein
MIAETLRIAVPDFANGIMKGGQAGSSCHRMRRGKMEYAGERPISGVSVRKDHPQYAGKLTPSCIPRARRARQTGGLARLIIQPRID